MEADLCVIGAGAAGLAIASRFFRSRTRVALLESGGLEADASTQSLYRGRSVGQAHAPLDQCRLRFFGGTTNHWTAHVRPLDPIDFEKRPWVPHSGWPFAQSQLEDHYAAAGDFLGLPPRPFEVDAWQGQLRTDWPLAPDLVLPQMRQVVRGDKRVLGQTLRADVDGSRNVDAYLYANVLRIEQDEARRQVTGLSVGSLSGVRFTLRARRYVLAAGGIENPRILLLSSVGNGPGNKPGLVGRFFANHPELLAGYLVSGNPKLQRSSFAPLPHRHGRAIAFLSLPAAVQRSARLHNCKVNLLPTIGARQLKRRIAARTPAGLPATRRARFRDLDVAQLASDMDVPPAPSTFYAPPASPSDRPVGMLLINESAPNPDSRVRLSDEVDALGQRRAELDWRLDPADLRSAHETLRVLAGAVGAAGIGRVRVLLPQRGLETLDVRGSHHHMGTTRMHVDPAQGVVDANCRVHGLANLFVAGSSVFPTYGAVNPTFTIIALAFRLADHLRGLE